MERYIRGPLTLPKHSELLSTINNTRLAITIYHTHIHDDDSKPIIKDIKQRLKQPTWEDVLDLLKICYEAVNEQRQDPIKY